MALSAVRNLTYTLFVSLFLSWTRNIYSTGFSPEKNGRWRLMEIGSMAVQESSGPCPVMTQLHSLA